MVLPGHLQLAITLASNSCRVILLLLTLSVNFYFSLKQILRKGMNLAISNFISARV